MHEQEIKARKYLLKHILVFAALLALGFLTYSNSLKNNFLMDDHKFLFQDHQLHNLKFLFYQFVPDLSKNLTIENAESAVYYRPLAHILPMLGHFFFEEDPFGYHVANLFLFISCGFLIYCFLYLLSGNLIVSFLSACLFIAHPINGLFVNYITASVFSVQVIFLVASTLLFVLVCEHPKRKILWTGSLFSYVMAILCHETSFFLPVYLICLLIILKKYSFRSALSKTMPFLIILIMALVLRLQFASLKLSIIDKLLNLNINFFEYVATFTTLIVWYISKLATLNGIVIIWTTAIVKNNLFFWNSVFILLLVFPLIAILLRKRYAYFSFSFLWFIAGFIPVSLACVFEPDVGFIIEPHWLFFSSIGFFMMGGMFLSRIFLKYNKVFSVSFISIILAVLIFNSRAYNQLWEDEKKYCSYWLKEAPLFKTAAFYLANTYFNDKEYIPARKYFSIAQKNTFSDWQILNNLGLIDLEEGKIEEAIHQFKKAQQFNPKSGIIQNSLGLAFSRKGEIDTSQEYFKKAIEYNYFLLEPRLNLAAIYRGKKLNQKYEELLMENLLIIPSDERTLSALLIYYSQENQNEKLIEMGERILHQKHRSGFLLQAAGIFFQKNYHFQVLSFFEKALMEDPNNKFIYQELGKYFLDLNQVDQAIKVWKEGQKLDKNDTTFQQLINLGLSL